MKGTALQQPGAAWDVGPHKEEKRMCSRSRQCSVPRGITPSNNDVLSGATILAPPAK